MKSRLNSNLNRNPLEELADLFLVPSSLIRLTHRTLSENLPKNQGALQKSLTFTPYLYASIIEGARLLGYYELGRLIFS